MATSLWSGNFESSSSSSLRHADCIHQSDIVGDIGPVQRDIVQKLLHCDLLDLVVFFLQEAPVRTDGVDDLGHF